MAHTNGIERLQAILKRVNVKVFRHFSDKHLHRYVAEARSRHNIRQLNTAEQMRVIVRCDVADRLPCADAIRSKHTRQPALIKNWE